MTAQFDAEVRNHKEFRVVIFGSARIHPESPYYQQIHDLAKMIAHEGMDVVTGGGPGLMDAASSGHQAGNGKRTSHSIGLPIIMPGRPEAANKHLDIKKDFHRFSARLDTFMSLANCIVVAPGGVGTMLELMYTWQLMQVKFTCPIPIILLGDMWPEFLTWIERWQLTPGLIDLKDLNFIHLAKTTDEAMRVIRETHELFRTAGPDACLNTQRYRRGPARG